MSEWAARRFWKEVTVDTTGDGYTVRLDQRQVMTPSKAPLSVPTETMARRIAAEWDAQEGTIDPLTMPWTRSANSAIEKVSAQADEVRSHLAGYADTDLLLYRAAGPEALADLQRKGWDPILDWLQNRFGVRLSLTEGVMPIKQDETALDVLKATLESMSNFRLTGFHDMVSLTGSFSLALAVAEQHVTPERGWALSRIDEDWQIAQWGEDEEAKSHAEFKKSAFLHATEFFDAAKN